MATATLREAGITHIVNVTPNEKDFFPLSFTYLRVPVNDTASGRLDRHWEAAFTFIASAVAKGGRVMVHCSAGVSRSASLVIYWMMRKYRMTLMAAYRALKTSRGCIAPNFTFWQQLVGALVCALHAVVHLDHLCRAQTPSGSAWSACVSWGRASVTRRALQMQRSSWQAWCPAASWNTKKFASWTHFLHVPAVRSLLTYLPCGGFCFFCVVCGGLMSLRGLARSPRAARKPRVWTSLFGTRRCLVTRRSARMTASPPRIVTKLGKTES